MMAVEATFSALELKAKVDAERELLLDQRRRAERRTWRTLYFAGGAVAAAVILAGLWQLTNTQLAKERGDQSHAQWRTSWHSNGDSGGPFSTTASTMSAHRLTQELEEALGEIPVLDVHTHLVGGKLGARGLHDVLSGCLVRRRRR